MRFRNPFKVFVEIFVSGLITAIAINYLVVGFIDIVRSFDTLQQWLNQVGFWNFVNGILAGR